MVDNVVAVVFELCGKMNPELLREVCLRGEEDELFEEDETGVVEEIADDADATLYGEEMALLK